MVKRFINRMAVLAFLICFSFLGSCQSEKLNIVILGGHPDDADFKAGGTTINFIREGHSVLLVSVTNGDAGHHKMGGEELAERRRKEAQESGRRFGAKYIILDNPDGELLPTIENRNEIIKLIREWNADIVIGHRPNDYHPDHRNASILMQDAAYMVIVPNVVPGTPPLKINPVFLYMEDKFQKPYPFQPDLCIDITDSFEQKIYAMSAHQSQYFEWLPWTIGDLQNVPKNQEERLRWLAKKRKPIINEKERASLIKWYGKEKGSKITLAESFEICEYGRQPSDEEIRSLFGYTKSIKK